MKIYIELTDTEITETINGLTLRPPFMRNDDLNNLKERIKSSNKNPCVITIDEFTTINKAIQIYKNFQSR